MLQIEHVRRVYPGSRKRPARVAIDDVSLSVDPGEWVALLGPNGSGKSTLVRIISGTDAPDSGRVLLFGGSNHRAAMSRLSIVFQKPGLDPLLTVHENLRTAAALFGLAGADRDHRIDDITDRLGLRDRMQDRIATLSGGYQRRVDLARALLSRPQLLILDEATGGLDHQSRTAFLDIIADLRQRSGPDGTPLTIVMTTHLMDEAERASRVVMMAGGRIVADGPPAELRGQSGQRIIRVGPASEMGLASAAAILRDAGLTASHAGDQTISALAEHNLPALESAAVKLLRAGLHFEIAPPNLGDAYLAITGRELSSDPVPEPERKRR